ncbi:Crp/Fnr family transcriptional regulator [Flavobacteriaceae bacterium F89]|uniref:Crp/Fnr family transcriptional regulator n=1 Tax=Cerina litoralis TaxID=2874477 RepID=A0AAE3EVP1_9FLAO|nr:Crp/Fnr family transcriptional regulator [Cerina litoralis]MCG2461380.1 Crp/Fnr family transcriptional regulator [Cerina litoralis]
MIDLDILMQFDAEEMAYKKDELILSEGKRADFYYQITKGEVKMFNITEDGKEFVQGIFSAGNSFAEPPLFGDFSYPASAAATTDASLYRLSKNRFLELLRLHPNIHLKFTQILCNRLLYKSMIMKEVSVYPPEHRILSLLGYLKNENSPDHPYHVKLTRQGIAELTGMRVETVIRAIKKLGSEKKLTLKGSKIWVG